jgi:murein DD-endopeptidase MepM/ murein hydrolase activator NlpD
MAVEQVSVDILRILGLEATDEVDMKSYKGFLREKLVEISMGKKGLSREDEMAIREEFQRVKGSTATKVKKTTINPQAVFNRQLDAGGGLVKYKPPAPGSLARRVLPQQKVEESDILDRIHLIVISIKNALVKEENLRKKAEKNRRVKKDKEDKAAKESSLEKSAKGIVGALEKTFKPVVDIFKKIRDALILLFLGWTANRLLDWIQDPKNLKTFNAIVDFLSRNAGKLLLLFVLLNNPLVKVVRWLGRSMISFLVRMIADLTKGKGLLSGLRKGRGGGGFLGAAARVVTNPYVAVPLAFTGAAVAANEVTGQRQAAGVQAENKARAQAGQGLGVQGVGGVGDLGPTTPYGMFQGTEMMREQKINTGGLVKRPSGMMGEQNFDDGGVVEGPSGIDKVPANLTEGEVVFSKPAVKTFGEDFLLAMNKLGGGTNQPTYSGGRMYAAGGGIAIISRRGMRKSPTTGQMKMHHGVDISASKGTPLYAFSDGRIKEIRRVGQGDAGYGNSIYWIDNKGYGHLYAHLDKFVEGLSAGMEIKKGKMMGTVGSTGSSTGSHLHWEMGKNPNDVGRDGPSLIDPLTKYGHMTPFSGKPSPADRLEDPLSPLNQTDQQIANQQSQPPLTFANESDRRLYTAYLNYITQPMGRGLDIRPTIDQVVGVPGSAGPNQSPSSIVPSGSATPGNPQATVAAANRQIASPTR